jgi:uncharacterized membrane protein
MGDFNTEAFTLLGVAIVIIGLRTSARWIMVGPKNFQVDDYLMLVACVRLIFDLMIFFLLFHLLIMIGIGGVRIGNWRCIHRGRVVHGPCQ